MEIFFGHNLRLLRERKKRSQQQLAGFIGIKRSILNNYEHEISKPSIENLLLISEYFDISINTLLTVDFRQLSGTRLSALEKGLDTYVAGNKLRVLATTVNDKNEDNVELVSVKAKAGYTAGYADPEYISKLPAFQLPFLPRDKKHRVFQISGDSMLPVDDKSWVACQYVDNWNDIKEGDNYIVVTRDEGIIFKRVYNQIKQRQSLLLVSSNPAYKPYELPLKEVMEIWKYVMAFTGP